MAYFLNISKQQSRTFLDIVPKFRQSTKISLVFPIDESLFKSLYLAQEKSLLNGIYHIATGALHIPVFKSYLKIGYNRSLTTVMTMIIL